MTQIHPSFRSDPAISQMFAAMSVVGLDVFEGDKFPKFGYAISRGRQHLGNYNEFQIRWDGVVVDTYDHAVICTDVFAPTAAATIAAFKSNEPITTKCAG